MAQRPTVHSSLGAILARPITKMSRAIHLTDQLTRKREPRLATTNLMMESHDIIFAWDLPWWQVKKRHDRVPAVGCLPMSYVTYRTPHELQQYLGGNVPHWPMTDFMIGNCIWMMIAKEHVRGLWEAFRCCCYFILTLYVSLPFHFEFHLFVFHTARHIEAIDMHRCLSCRNGFVMRSPGSWLGGSRVSALRLFCLAPLGHLVNVWLWAVASWMTCSGRGTQVAWSLRLITALNMSFHRDSLVLVLFCLCVCVFVCFFLLWSCCLLVCFCSCVFLFSPWNHIISVHHEPEAYYSIGFYCRIHTE